MHMVRGPFHYFRPKRIVNSISRSPPQLLQNVPASVSNSSTRRQSFDSTFSNPVDNWTYKLQTLTQNQGFTPPWRSCDERTSGNIKSARTLLDVKIALSTDKLIPELKCLTDASIYTYQNLLLSVISRKRYHCHWHQTVYHLLLCIMLLFQLHRHPPTTVTLEVSKCLLRSPPIQVPECFRFRNLADTVAWSAKFLQPVIPTERVSALSVFVC